MNNTYYCVFSFLSLFKKSNDAINQTVQPELSGKKYIYTDALQTKLISKLIDVYTTIAHFSYPCENYFHPFHCKSLSCH